MTSRRQRRQHAIGGGPGAIDRPHEDAAQQAEHGHVDAVAARARRRSRGPGPCGGKLAGLTMFGCALEDGDDLAAAVDVVAQRDAVDAGGDQLADSWPASGPSRRRRSRRWPRPGRGPRRCDQSAHGADDDLPARLADDVADQQEPHDGATSCRARLIVCQDRGSCRSIAVYLAISVTRVSRSTVTLISPG